jgi:hypothetical protein
MLVVAHVSSMNTSRSGSRPTRRARRRDRRSATSGRSCSAARSVFLKVRRSVSRAFHSPAGTHLTPHPCAQLHRRRIGLLRHEHPQSRSINHPRPACTAPPWRDRARLAPPWLQPPHRRRTRPLVLGRWRMNWSSLALLCGEPWGARYRSRPLRVTIACPAALCNLYAGGRGFEVCILRPPVSGAIAFTVRSRHNRASWPHYATRIGELNSCSRLGFCSLVADGLEPSTCGL